jgi:thiamine-phosphate pyrophosphorylase
VHRAAAEGAAYATLSPFATSLSKPGYGPPVDCDAYASECDLPVLALGGIDPGNAARARAAGAHGVAVMGCVIRSASPAAVVRELLREVDR